MVGQPALDIKLDKLPKSALAADIIYIPLETPFLVAARQRGNRTVNGLGMLLNQGRPAWTAWFIMMESKLLRSVFTLRLAGGRPSELKSSWPSGERTKSANSSAACGW